MEKFLHLLSAARHGRSLSTLLRVTMLCIALCCMGIPAATAQQAGGNRITLSMKNSSIVEVVNAIRSTSGYRFLYSVNEVDQYPSRDFEVRDASLQQAMLELLKDTRLEYELENGVVVIKPAAQPQPQRRPGTIAVEGTVVGSDGEPLLAAAVVVKGTTAGTTTDQLGRFSFSAPAPDGPVMLSVSYLGMITQEVEYTGASLHVVMRESSTEVGEVVVTGIFLRQAESFSGSVTTLSGDDVMRYTSSNPLNALAIADPSFRISTSNLTGSNPSAMPDIQLRGGANLGDYSADDAVVLRGDYNTRPNQPLYVLDGIIGVNASDIMDLDPEQIESMTILKDAAATVIYGSQAANGVVVVETKKPVAGKLRVTYNGNYGVSMPDLSVYDLTNAAEKLAVEEAAGYFDTNDIDILRYYAEVKHNVLRGVDTDWISQPVRTAVTHRHAIAFEGGETNLRYKVRLGANFEPGVMKNSGLEKQSGQVDIHYRFGKFQIINQTFLNFSRGDRESNYGSFNEYIRMNPYYSPYDENGNLQLVLDPQTLGLGNYSYFHGGGATLNPMYNTIYNSRNENRELQMKESLRIEYRPMDALWFDLNFVMTKTRGTTEVFTPAQHTKFHDIFDPSQKGSYSYSNAESDNFDLHLTGRYTKTFNQDHFLSVNARYSLSQRKSYLSTIEMLGFPNDKLSEVFMGTTFDNITGNEQVNRSLGMVLSANYSYKHRYAVDFSGRLDASSQFGRDNRYAPFWSLGARWNLHNEEFLKQTGFLDELVLRANYGITGSQDFESYQALQMYTYRNTTSIYASSDVVGAVLYGMGNPELKWQQTDAYNAGLDFSLFKGIVSARLDVYKKLTHNTLLDFTVAPSVGVSSVKDNLGEISNTGYEISLRLMPYSNPAKGAYWNIVLNGAHNKSKIVKISEALRASNEKIYSDTDKTNGLTDEDRNSMSKPLPQYVNGASMTSIWGLRSVGIDPQTGEEIFLTRDGEYTTQWNAKDRVIIGDTAPTLNGSISTTFAYQNFSLTVAGSYTFGGDIYNNTLADRIENVNLRDNVDKRVFTERWSAPGDVATYKRIDGDFTRARTNATSRFVMRNNEFTLSSINVSYRMTSTEYPFLRKAGLSTASVGLYFTDILRLSTVRMERGIYYPFARTISMSLNLSF